MKATPEQLPKVQFNHLINGEQTNVEVVYDVIKDMVHIHYFLLGATIANVERLGMDQYQLKTDGRVFGNEYANELVGRMYQEIRKHRM